MKRLIAILLLLAISGCGYQVPGHEGALPDGIEAIRLTLFVNKSKKPRLEVPLTDAVADALTRIPGVRLVTERDNADAVAEGTILSYGTSAISYDQNDKIREYRARMTIEAKIRRAEDGKLLWQERLAWQEPFPANDDKALQTDLEDRAILEINRRLADQFLSRLMADF